MNDINFVEVDAKKTFEEIISEFEKEYTEALYPGDERRIFLQQLVPIIVGIKNKINDNARQNLLRYSRNEKLDALGKDIFSTVRLQANKAICKGKIKLSDIQNKDVYIEEGKRVTPDGTLFFIIKNSIIIKPGELEKECLLEAIEPGEKYNNFLAGQIKNIVDPIPFVESIVNIETSTGGTDIETDEQYRERCRLSPESYSTAGPNGAYKYWAKTASSAITDVEVNSPSPGVVQIIPLLKNGVIPDSNILEKVFEICSAKDKRPLTDKVEVSAPKEVSYNINLTYFLDKKYKTEELKFRKNIEGENLDLHDGAIRDYIDWQKEHLGEAINPDMLRFKIQNAATYESFDKGNYTVVRKILITEPSFTEIQNTEVAKVGTITVNYGGLE